jgi:hypothetical protein
MTLRGAHEDEIVRAVKHSMVVIDAEKHKLDYKRSERENGIAELKKKYQGYINEDGDEVGGASTLLSRRKQDIIVPERQGSGIIDPVTGKVTYRESGRTYMERKKVMDKTTGKQAIDPNTGKPLYVSTGRILKATDKEKLILAVDDVRSLSSGTQEENAYADYANRVKALANKARVEYKRTGTLKYSPSAKETYSEEVNVLQAKLNAALMNAPLERKAKALANSKVKAQIQDNPNMDKAEKRKAGQRAINDARNAVGADGKASRISISDREWEAIQAGAITDTTLTQILRYADPDAIKQRATPRTSNQLSPTKVSKIKAYSSYGYTNAQIAEALGISSSTVSNYVNG